MKVIRLRRGAAAALVAVAMVVIPVAAAQAWTGSSITCTSSTGWQIHIKATTTGVRYDKVVNGSAQSSYDLGYINGTYTNKTGKSVATSVSVSGGTVSNASRFCGTN
ncbi:hypothetical protein [Cellulomonas sp. B6]|jgi:hypothetical protein|uniref:hypothetical protein n=1 Tax=Cellulomonas sp. B6 TaxID=1295626 RepID=UPI000A512785|nr:hypothetical protein [Cellulomonas sp. B6]